MSRGRLVAIVSITIIVALPLVVAVGEMPTPSAEIGVVAPSATHGGFVDVDPVDLPGSGTDADPYIISNVSELQAMEDDLDASYRLGADIDASETADWNNGTGFNPIGEDLDDPTGEPILDNPFSGEFDGAGHTISELTIDRPEAGSVGLFGYINDSGEIHDVSLMNVNITGSNRVGGLAATNRGTVRETSVSGSVTGSNRVGGLVGQNGGIDNGTGTMRKVSASGPVNGSVGVGGVVGTNRGTIRKASASGSVTGSRFVGGFAGINNGSSRSGFGGVRNVSASGNVSGSDFVGGLTGVNFQATVREAFASGPITGSTDVGGLVGNNTEGTIQESYWDVDTTGQADSAGGTGLTTTRMIGEAARTNMTGLEFGTVWEARPDDYPVLIALSGTDSANGTTTPGDTETKTETPDGTTTPGDTETKTETPDGTTTPGDTETESSGQPGFSITIAVVSLLAVLALRRRR